MVKIGVFDSGIGGQSVATALQTAFPNDEVIFVHDSAHVPYGTKTEEEILTLALPKLKDLKMRGCELIVIACNSLSTSVLPELKKSLPAVKLIPVEPMLEEALAITKTGIVTVCATPRTLSSGRYADLMKRYCQNSVVIEPDCSEWAYMIEKNLVDRARIKVVVEDSLEQGSDVIVLGCTHYHWIEKLIKEIVADKAEVIQPENKIVALVKKELARLG